ncbi:non-canonical purine NTP pyrophosphatase, rdgB/HAM1 family [Bernardetia litoralis DSM 6794]|uniref:dITP/XTP pyrophosphatase n=1 Tax=Bernardetia litoralis (strain ATCC 23117 / DSM 6794 / NBRC 15988 / NCIMB 1366 / Fx l1 / Sio-4) TaxID=880071 RepID=I4AQV9_BERLS|nr:RdgB/HAM1 family non-canonical purine NTP pyrophosphatase [Bernardetia litoralis]AFM06344.1 non-canonical purine NTP pyrophosphatase, rdgB/HAM1 family [Bernardetia litoralis DSM 6794]
MKICFATNNSKKIEEVKAALPSTIQLVSLKEIGCTEEIPETTPTIEGNSEQKAMYVYQNYATNCFADDTGLEIEALNGQPGVSSAMYADEIVGSYRDSKENMKLVLKNLNEQAENGNTNRNAQFKTVFTLVLDGKKQQFEGIIKGKIIDTPRGEDGFGYDPIFVPNGYDETFAEMPLSEKNKISHRAIATRKLVEFLNKLDEN